MKLLSCLCSTAQEKNYDDYLQDGNNHLTAKMFYEVVKDKPDKSVVLSAYSVMTPLAQLALASVGESHDELLDTIGMPDDIITKAAFLSAASKLRSIKGITLKTVSKIYVADNYKLNTEFVSVTRSTFGSEAQNINFNMQEKAADEVNAWIESQTNNRIKNLISPGSLSEDTRALLVNAIYFKGSWKKPFNKDATSDKDFYVTKETVKQIPTMYNSGSYKYIESDKLNAQILEIPYEGDESSCVFVLPREIDGIKQLEEKLKDPKALDSITKNLHREEVKIFLPKFKIETTTDLKDILQKMNVKKVFSPVYARLDNLLDTDEELYIDTAFQKAFIDINEEGSEAAAANVFGIMVATSLNKNYVPPKIFKADRPFYFAVKFKSLTLFNGVMLGV